MRRFLPGEISGLVLGVGILLLATFVALFQPWPLKIVIDSVLGDAPPPRVVQWLFSPFAPLLPSPPRLGLLTFICAGLLVIELMIGGGKVLSTYVLNAVALRLVFRVRCALFDHLQRQSLAFHDAKTVGDSLYRVTWDSYCIQSMFSSALVPALTASLTLAGIVLVLLSRDPLLALAAVVIAGPLIVVIQRMERPMTEQASRVHEHESGLSARVQETLSSIRAVQAFGREQHESERFRDRAVASLAANLRLILLQSASQAIVGLILAAGTGAVIWICARGVLSGRLSSGEVVLLVAYAVMLFKPLETLAYTAATAQSAAAEARRVWAVLDATPDVADTVQGRPLPSRARGQVTFDRVSFAYGSGAPVLHEVSLELRAGSAVALVGRSGAGKTTLASLVPRFYDPTGGRVLLDGDDLRDITLESLRRNIAIVTQEPVLFATSVRDNIVYGRPDATEREVEVAARAAGAHEFIAELPDGYDTVLAERGATLSGGQRQRISIARAFLKDAPILILDEPTSALDAHSEQHLLTAFGRLMRGRTTIIIAHRMSTVRIADLIVVLEAGRIVEAGTHADLLARPASFAGLYRLQVGGVETSATAAVY